MFRLEENFTKFRYEDWLPLSNEDIYQLNEKDFQVINVLQEKFKEDLVDKSYLSMVDLLSINIRNYNRINRKIKDTKTSETTVLHTKANYMFLKLLKVFMI